MLKRETIKEYDTCSTLFYFVLLVQILNNLKNLLFMLQDSN